MKRAIEAQLSMKVTILALGDKASLPNLRPSELNGSTLRETIVSAIRLYEPQVLILDLPWWETEFSEPSSFLPPRTKNPRLVVIDGPASTHGRADLNFVPSFLSPDGFGAQECEVRFGWDCFLLPHRITSAGKNRKPSVLVMTGGSDAANLGEEWPRLLENSLESEIPIRWVRGPLARVPRNPRGNRFTVYSNQSQIPKLIASSSVGLSVHGISAYELIASGLPTVTFSPYGDKDSKELSILEELGICLVARSAHEAVEMATHLLNDPISAEKMAERGSELFSIAGQTVLAAEIERILEEQRC